MRFFIFVTLLAISACVATHKAADPEVLIQANRKAALEKIDVLACLDRGGVVKSVCMFGAPACVQQFYDAGTVCSDDAECKGDCRIEEGFVEPGTKMQGFCSADDDPCGCRQIIEQGIAKQPICAD